MELKRIKDDAVKILEVAAITKGFKDVLNRVDEQQANCGSRNTATNARLGFQVERYPWFLASLEKIPHTAELRQAALHQEHIPSLQRR